MTTAAVVGGGITGLVAARELAAAGVDVTVFESSDRVGGKILTIATEDGPVEAGPDAFLARDDTATALCRELGLEAQLVAPDVFGALIYRDKRLHRLPQGFPYGLPASPQRAVRSGALSTIGALRAYGDLLSPRPLRGPDVTVGSFVRSRFGVEALEALVDPVLAGTRAGDPEDMSLAAALPQVDAIARSHRSLLRGFTAARRAGNVDLGPPPFLGLRAGMHTLVERLVASFDDNVFIATGTPVERIEPGPRVIAVDGSAAFDSVVLTSPTFAAASLVQELDPTASGALHAIDYASVAILTLVYPQADVMVPGDVSGVLIPGTENTMIAAFTWYSAKWSGRASPGRAIVRAFVGREAGEAGAELPDETLVQKAAEELHVIAGIEPPPIEAQVFRWPRAMPQYRVGHLDRVAEIEKRLERHGVYVAGAGYRGTGIPDCIKQAKAAAVKATRHSTVL